MERDNLIKLGFSGDFCPVPLSSLTDEETTELLSTIQALNEKVDFSVTNFECTIIPSKDGEIRRMSIQNELCDAIPKMGFDLFCLANNHILDYGTDGLLFTKKYLENNRAFTVGANKDIQTAAKPIVLTIKTKKIGFFNFTDATHYTAKKDKAGVNAQSNRSLMRQIKSARKELDAVIVIIHSDLEFSTHPAPWKVRLSRHLADIGADIIIHHHPHVLQGVEKYKNTLIAYSLGNFLFPLEGNSYQHNRAGHPDESVFLIVSLDFSDSLNISHEIVPVVISGNMTRLATNEKASVITTRLQRLSNDLLNSNLLRHNHFNNCRKHMVNYIYGIYYEYAKKGRKSSFRYFIHHLRSKMHTAWMRGFFTFGIY